MNPSTGTPPKQEAATPVGERTLSYLTRACAAAVIAIQCCSMTFPSAFNWGTHQLAFFPLAVRIAVVGMMVAVLFRRVSGAILSALSTLNGKFKRTRAPLRKLLVVAAMTIAVFLFWYARESTHLLGDGNLVARTLPTLRNAENIPLSSFENEPLAAYIIWNVYGLFNGYGIDDASLRAYQFTSLLFGAASIITVIFLTRLLVTGPLERLLVGLSILGAGGSQLFFGYVEDYTGLYFGCLLFFTLALYAIRQRIDPVVPSIAFGVLLALHLGSVSMLPLLLFLAYMTYRRDGVLRSASTLAAALVFALVFFWISGYRELALVKHPIGSGDHALPLFRVATPGQAYTLFSPAHLIDFGNILLLLSPFSILACGLAATVLLKIGRVKDDAWRFLGLAVGCSLAFTFALNCALGMSRDWDLASSFELSLVMLVPLACANWIGDAMLRRRTLVVVCAITILSTIPWIAVNAGEERSLARFEMLPDRILWSKNAFQNAYDELASLYKEKKEYGKALEYCDKYLQSDSNNARIYGKMGELYELLGDQDKELSYYTKAIDHGMRNWQLCFYVGSTYGTLHQYSEAIAVTAKGLEINPRSAPAWINLGSYYVNGPTDYASALRSFQKAIEIDSTNAEVYTYAGKCAYLMSDVDGMKGYFHRYCDLTGRPFESGEMQKFLGTSPAAPQKRTESSKQ